MSKVQRLKLVSVQFGCCPSCCPFVAALLRVRPQFRLVFTELLRMLRVWGEGKGGPVYPYSSTGAIRGPHEGKNVPPANEGTPSPHRMGRGNSAAEIRLQGAGSRTRTRTTTRTRTITGSRNYRRGETARVRSAGIGWVVR